MDIKEKPKSCTEKVFENTRKSKSSTWPAHEAKDFMHALQYIRIYVIEVDIAKSKYTYESATNVEDMPFNYGAAFLLHTNTTDKQQTTNKAHKAKNYAFRKTCNIFSFYFSVSKILLYFCFFLGFLRKFCIFGFHFIIVISCIWQFFLATYLWMLFSADKKVADMSLL